MDEQYLIVGKQQCMYGIDEDGCDELEYNECSENEYRCDDGSCIAEEFWLDGQFDCSDKSDEQELDWKVINGQLCPLQSSRFDCDERTAHHLFTACGDGEFISGELMPRKWQCRNYRAMMFFCELFQDVSDQLPTWTIENGACVKEPQIPEDFANVNEEEQCILYLKCSLAGRTSSTCDAVVRRFQSACQNKTVKYPSAPVLSPFTETMYDLTQLNLSSKPSYILFIGTIKCLGQQSRAERHFAPSTWDQLELTYPLDVFFCNRLWKINYSDPRLPERCWHNAEQSFLCLFSLQCISRHRVSDHTEDCHLNEDEIKAPGCYVMKRHRFNCSEKPDVCLSTSKVGDDKEHCLDGSDEYLRKLKWRLNSYRCREPNSMECSTLKSYIQSSPYSVPTVEDRPILLFRAYCDTLWQLPKGFDESLCNAWKCPKDQYQCLSGHCISINLMHGFTTWNCPDASDTIEAWELRKPSEHNAPLIDYSSAQQKVRNAIYNYDRGGSAPFAIFCDRVAEYTCILANVTNPLNFTLNRPCINRTQIGDGTIDCYGGLDERNILTCGKHIDEQQGFDFPCSDQECIPYQHLCEQRCSNRADDLLCNQLKILWNPSCDYRTRMDRCSFDEEPTCDPFRISKYYCDKDRDSEQQA